MFCYGSSFFLFYLNNIYFSLISFCFICFSSWFIAFSTSCFFAFRFSLINIFFIFCFFSFLVLFAFYFHLFLISFYFTFFFPLLFFAFAFLQFAFIISILSCVCFLCSIFFLPFDEITFTKVWEYTICNFLDFTNFTQRFNYFASANM